MFMYLYKCNYSLVLFEYKWPTLFQIKAHLSCNNSAIATQIAAG